MILGYINTRFVANLPTKSWRVKNTERCDDSLTHEYRTGRNNMYFSWLLRDCTGTDVAVYYAYDAFIGGITLTLASAGALVLVKRNPKI